MNEEERSQAMWDEFLARMPPEFAGDPEKFLADYRAIVAKEKELEAYRDWYHGDYLRWKATFDEKSYAEYIESQQPAQLIATVPLKSTAPVEPPTVSPQVIATPEAKSPSTLPRDEPIWDWADLAEAGPVEVEAEVMEPGDVPLLAEDVPAIATQVQEEPTDWRWHAGLLCWYTWRQCIAGIARWLR